MLPGRLCLVPLLLALGVGSGGGSGDGGDSRRRRLLAAKVNKHKPWIETSYHGVITENNDTVILDPPLVALDKDAPVPFAGRMTGILICSGRTHSGGLMPNLHKAELGPKSYCHHPMFRWPVIFMLCVSSPCQCGLFISL
ncbi:calsyntenin-2-like [Rattus rattus]|uniref:calsyntenin-2-like n=1 Tax=Rattus rattus TaxID=10117 RepID=UPI0013F36C34|nr:calsyntenin-2-like [Rattus rattus]